MNDLLIISDAPLTIGDTAVSWGNISHIHVNDLAAANQWLQNNDVSVIIIANEPLKELSTHWMMLLGIPYFVFGSEEDATTALELPIPPKAFYLLPLQQEHIEEVITQIQQETEQPSRTFINEIAGDEKELLDELMEILEKQFDDSIKKIPYLYEQGQQEELIQVVHKLLGKFSLLSMPQAFEIFNQVEKHLRDGQQLHQHTYRRILSDLEKGLTFIRKYNQNNEVHHR